MSGAGGANRAPPYYAVIFSSVRNGQDEEGYAEASSRMLELAAQQPGFLGVESARGADGFGITVPYWESEAAISTWREHANTPRCVATAARTGTASMGYGWSRSSAHMALRPVPARSKRPGHARMPLRHASRP